MASEIQRDREYGRFRPTPTERRKSKKPSRQLRREGNDPKHLAAQRKACCVICGSRVNLQAHHLKQDVDGTRSFGRKALDCYTLTLCSAPRGKLGGCHLLIEEAGPAFETVTFALYGVPFPRELADEQWKANRDPSAIVRATIRLRSFPFTPIVMRDLNDNFDLRRAA